MGDVTAVMKNDATFFVVFLYMQGNCISGILTVLLAIVVVCLNAYNWTRTDVEKGAVFTNNWERYPFM